jgi:hypothetical protein
MDILLEHPFPIAALLLFSLLMYAGEIIVKKTLREKKTLRNVLIAVFTTLALLASTALIVVILSYGGGVEPVLAVLLLSLLGTLL